MSEANDGKVTRIIAKGRIALAETLSVPKLKLFAAVIGARLTKYELEAIQQEVNKVAGHFWCVRQVV